MATKVSKASESKSVKPELAVILDRIDALSRDIRELKGASTLPRRPSPDGIRLTRLQERVLQVLAQDVEMTSSEVAKALNRTRALLVNNLNQPVALGLVERVRRKRIVYFRRRPPETTGITNESFDKSGCYLFTVLSSKNVPENIADAKALIFERLKDMPGWKIEQVTMLPES